jgi:hypothetical protein
VRGAVRETARGTAREAAGGTAGEAAAGLYGNKVAQADAATAFLGRDGLFLRVLMVPLLVTHSAAATAAFDTSFILTIARPVN